MSGLPMARGQVDGKAVRGAGVMGALRSAAIGAIHPAGRHDTEAARWPAGAWTGPGLPASSWSARRVTALLLTPRWLPGGCRRRPVTTSMYNMLKREASTKDQLIDSTRELLWEQGYAATSPRATVRRRWAMPG